MTAIDLQFLIQSQVAIPADHGYALVGAVSRLIPSAHGGDGYAIAPIAGRQIGNRHMKLTPSSRFVIRTAPDRIAEFLPLAGKTIDIQGRKLQLGVPTVQPLVPSPKMKSRLVTIKGFFQPETFAEAVQRQLTQLDIHDAEIQVGRQRTLRIKRNEIVGFATVVSGLSDDDSLKLAAGGIGGRRHMGCGFFVPARLEANDAKS